MKRGHMPKIATQNKHVTKGGENKCGKVGHYKCKGKWGGGRGHMDMEHVVAWAYGVVLTPNISLYA